MIEKERPIVEYSAKPGTVAADLIEAELAALYEAVLTHFPGNDILGKQQKIALAEEIIEAVLGYWNNTYFQYNFIAKKLNPQQAKRVILRHIDDDNSYVFDPVANISYPATNGFSSFYDRQFPLIFFHLDIACDMTNPLIHVIIEIIVLGE